MDSLTSTGLEQLTGDPASTWRYWAINDTGPRSFKIGRLRVWRRTDVLAWIAQRFSGASEPPAAPFAWCQTQLAERMNTLPGDGSGRVEDLY